MKTSPQPAGSSRAVDDDFRVGVLPLLRHELRTPVAGILNLAEVLLEGVLGDLSPRQKEYVVNIQKNGQRLLTTIEEILELEALSSGAVTLRQEACDLALLCRQSYASIESIAAERKHKVRLSIPSGPVAAKVDPEYFKKALSALFHHVTSTTPASGEWGFEAKVAPQNFRVEIWSRRRGTFSFGPSTTAGPAHDTRCDALKITLAKRILELHAGVMEVTARAGSELRITLSIPRKPRLKK
jgi:K+-sensing histidine kinase KdpD